MSPVRIFYASPRDTADELSVARHVVERLNLDLGAKLGVQIELVQHTTHAHASYNPGGPQEVVNHQLDPSRSDVVLGVFLHRFGTPDPENQFASGAQSEIDECIKHWSNHGTPEIMMFFGKSADGFDPNNTEHLRQKTHVMEYRERLAQGVYAVDFIDTGDFEVKLSEHLTRYLNAKVDGGGKAKQRLCIKLLEDTGVFAPNKPRQVADICLKMTERLLGKLERLALGEVIEDASLDDQYTFASGVAEYYRNKAGPFTAWATSLDLPSAFFQGHQNYFEMQEDFAHWEDETFRDFARQELMKFGNLPKRGPSEAKATTSDQLPGIPAKSRIVVGGKQSLLDELTAMVQTETHRSFWLFNFWHVRHHFGLKYYLCDDDENYQDQLCNFTGEDKQLSIDDFIVYGTDCVFGRVDPKPNPDTKLVTLRMLTAGDRTRRGVVEKIKGYKLFFEKLWRDKHCLSLADLLLLPDERAAAALSSSQKQVDNLRLMLSRV